MVSLCGKFQSYNAMVPTIGDIEPSIVDLDTMWPIQLKLSGAEHSGYRSSLRVKTTNQVIIVISNVHGTS